MMVAVHDPPDVDGRLLDPVNEAPPDGVVWPTYAELLERLDGPPGSSWGLFDNDPERGMANFASPTSVRKALDGVRTGTLLSLDYPLDAFNPSIAKRTPPRHTITSTHRDQRDDYLDGFWLQASSHLDGLRHRRHAVHGFYNGIPDELITAYSPELGVNRWSEVPIAGRGVLVDVAAFRLDRGEPIDHAQGEVLTSELLDLTLEWQATFIEPGDIVLIHTGWANWYLETIDSAGREEICRQRRSTGFEQSHSTLAWFWDHKVAMAASDTFALEALPASPSSGFGGETDRGMIHQELIALLGLPIGELWRLHELAETCALDREYESFIVVKPLNLIGGVGSPANAIVIR
jgi:kynurenine formamidase